MSADLDVNHYEVNNEKVKANGGWITQELLQELINNHEGNEDFRVVGSEVKAAVGVGDNYLSIIYRMTADLVNSKTGVKVSRQFLIKGLPTAKILLTVIEEFEFFKKEMYVYKVCLPIMRRIMEEYMPDESDFLAAESFNCHLPNVLVLEDLKVSGYKMAHRREQLNFEHAAITVRCLARFHALSVRLIMIKPEVEEEISRKEFYTDKEKNGLGVHVEKAIKSWLKVMGERETPENLLPVMKKVTENFLGKIADALKKNAGSFVTMNHGDSWTNNFLYKYDEDGNVIHARMVDFQIARFACPVLDLLYFIFSSLQPDMLGEKFDEIIEIYHDALLSDMKKLRLDSSGVPTLEEIRREMRARSIIGVMAMIMIAPMCLAKPSDVPDLENVDQKAVEMSEDYMMENNYRDSYYQEVMIKYAAIMDKMGYFESAQELTTTSSVTNGN